VVFNEFIQGLYCVRCGELRSYDPLLKFCPRCLQPLITRYRVKELLTYLDVGGLRNRVGGVLRFREVLPITTDLGVSLGEGGTRLIKSSNLGRILNIRELYLKNEALNPTGTFIDRGVFVDVVVAKALGFRNVAAAALGDYGISLSAYSARAGLNPLIVMPSNVSLSKLYQVIMLRGRVKFLNTYSQCVTEVLGISSRYGYYPSLHSSHTVLDGYKTLAYEVLEGLGWEAPDVVVVPTADGALLSMIYYGMLEARDLGLVGDVRTRLIAVQSAASPAIAMEVLGTGSVGVGDSIAFDLLATQPLMKDHAVNAIRSTGGTAVIVSDDEILSSMHDLARYEGLIVEPESAAGIAGLTKLISNGVIRSDDRVVVVITGSAFKDPILLKRVINFSKDVRMELTSLSVEGEGLGETKMRILEVIAVNGTLHPYGIWKALKTSYGISVRPATVYQHLRDLELRGLVIKSPTEGRRVTYRLSELGKLVLERERGSPL